MSGIKKQLVTGMAVAAALTPGAANAATPPSPKVVKVTSASKFLKITGFKVRGPREVLGTLIAFRTQIPVFAGTETGIVVSEVLSTEAGKAEGKHGAEVKLDSVQLWRGNRLHGTYKAVVHGFDAKHQPSSKQFGYITANISIAGLPAGSYHLVGKYSVGGGKFDTVVGAPFTMPAPKFIGVGVADSVTQTTNASFEIKATNDSSGIQIGNTAYKKLKFDRQTFDPQHGVLASVMLFRVEWPRKTNGKVVGHDTGLRVLADFGTLSGRPDAKSPTTYLGSVTVFKGKEQMTPPLPLPKVGKGETKNGKLVDVPLNTHTEGVWGDQRVITNLPSGENYTVRVTFEAHVGNRVETETVTSHPFTLSAPQFTPASSRDSSSIAFGISQ